MSDFLDYLQSKQNKTNENKTEQHKNMKNNFSVEELEQDLDDDFYEEPVTEARRVLRPNVPVNQHMPARQPAQNNIYRQRPAVQPAYDEPAYEEPEQLIYEEPAQPRRTRKSALPVAESSIRACNPVLNEAYELIDEMKNKMEMMFFKYGMTGLEKLNECMLDMCDTIMNPPVQKPVEQVIPQQAQPVIEKTLPKKKPVVSKPVNKKPTVQAKPSALPKAKESVSLKAKASAMNKMFETADLGDLGSTLSMQSDKQVNIGQEHLDKIEARANALREQSKTTAKNKKQQQETTKEDIEPEEIEIVPDGTNPIEMINLENAELDIPAEENEEN